MKPPRDSQRQKVYDAERTTPMWDEAKFETLGELEVWLKGIMARAWFKRRWPTFRELRVMDGRGRRHACGEGSGISSHPIVGYIKMPLWARTRIVALHELAHCLIVGNVAPHGREYCKVYAELVQFGMGKDDSDALKKAFRAHRAKYSTPRKDKK